MSQLLIMSRAHCWPVPVRVHMILMGRALRLKMDVDRIKWKYPCNVRYMPDLMWSRLILGSSWSNLSSTFFYRLVTALAKLI